MESARRAPAPIDADDGHGLRHPSPRAEMTIDALRRELWKESIRQEVIAAEIAERRGLEVVFSRDLRPVKDRIEEWTADEEDPSFNRARQDKKVSSGMKRKRCAETFQTNNKKICVQRSCVVRQVNSCNEFYFEEHSAGNRHHSNVAALESRKETIGMKKKAEATLLSVTRYYPPTWNCGICQANCSSELDLENHLRGRRHQENLEALKRKGKEMESELYAKEVLQLAEKNQKFVPRWSCSTCKANCTSASDLKNHFRGRRNRQKMVMLHA
uniref:C2H2-type domain-containing protein n=2 Tax=Leersia perrieri TaxID=77586 RepID=A0A0D9X8B5_9ORYZ